MQLLPISSKTDGFLVLIKILFILLLFSTSQTASAQNPDTIGITINFTGSPLSDVFYTLHDNYNLSIYYKDEWFKGMKYTGSFKSQPATEVIPKILTNTGIMYILLDNTFYLVPSEDVALILKKMISSTSNFNEEGLTNYKTIGDIKNSGKYKTVKITGTITDGANGDVLIGSKILVENTNYYAVTGYSGAYVLDVPAGIYRLKVTSMGFEDKFIDIKAISPGSLNIEMFEESHAINEVVVSSEKTNRNVTRNQMSVLEMNAASIKQLPSLIGERDILKSFASMPGVKTASEFGAGINVRGGGEDQNLYLIENVPVFNTAHVMGLLSVINPDAVSQVTLYKGHIPNEYGERVSSVMDIKISDPTINKFRVKGGIGIYSSRLLLETPIGGDIVKFKLGGRTSYSDFLLTKMPSYELQNSSASFYDLTSTLTLNLKNNPVTFFGYYSHDYFKYSSDFSYKYGNALASGSWKHSFNPSLTSEIYGGYSRYQLSNENTQNLLKAYVKDAFIESLTGKINFNYYGLSNQELNAGAQIITYTNNPGDRTPLEGAKEITAYESYIEHGRELSGFIGDKVNLGTKLSLQLGLRYTLFQNFGPRTVYSYSDSGTDSTVYSDGEKIIDYSGLEPRLSIKYMLTPESSIKASYNRNKQYLSLLSYTSISTPEDSWKLADPNLEPIICNQMAIGYYRNLKENSWETSIELYGKTLQNLTEYKNGAQLQFNNQVEQELLNAEGRNYGVEISIKKNTGKITGALAYTYSRAFKKTNEATASEGINRNEWFASAYDVPHDLSVALSYKVNRRIRFGANFSYATGRPYTAPEYTYDLGYEELVYYSDRNKYRLPDYHRLDISLDIDESLKKKKPWKGSWSFAILNVYARKNAYSLFYKKDTPSEENNYEMFSMYKMYLIGIPMPTITYNFIF